MSFRLSRAADDDITRIYLEGAQQFGIDQADRYHSDLARIFELIAERPLMARERAELSLPVRVHPHGVHLIVYMANQEGVLILRVRHGREDWEAELR